MRVVAAVALLLLGCEPQARPREEQRSERPPPPPPAQAPQEPPRPPPPPPPAMSRLGEYFWVSGQVNVEKGRISAAIEAFQRAVSEFENERKDLPAALLCDYGGALRRKTGDARAAEQAARLLHKCFLLSTPGAPERQRALRELVELEAAGLDPSLIAREGPADTYLTKPPHKAPVEEMAVKVGRTQKASDRGYEAWARLLEGADARGALARCFEPYWQAAQQSSVSVLVPLKLKARLDEDDLYAGGTLELGVDPALSGAEKAFGECLANELRPLAELFARRGSDNSWTGAVTVTVTVKM